MQGSRHMLQEPDIPYEAHIQTENDTLRGDDAVLWESNL